VGPQLELLLRWPEQREYELLRPVVVFGGSIAERARETGVVSERTLRRNADHFDEYGMPSLFGAEPVKYQRLPPAVRRLIVDRKSEYPAFSLGEIARICYIAFGGRPSKHTVKRVIEEEPADHHHGVKRRRSPHTALRVYRGGVGGLEGSNERPPPTAATILTGQPPPQLERYFGNGWPISRSGPS